MQEINQRYNTFNDVALEIDEIKESWDIIKYEKQPKEKVPTTLTDEELNNINTELERQRTELSDTGRDAPYSQEGIDQIESRSEDAKNLLSSINEEILHYHNNSKLI